jgi:hypothetical protein
MHNRRVAHRDGTQSARPNCRQSAPYSPEFEPDIGLTEPHASGVDETCTHLLIAEGGNIPLH